MMDESKGVEGGLDAPPPPRVPSHLSYMQVALNDLKRGKLNPAVRNLKKSVRICKTDRNQYLLAVAHLLRKEFYDALGIVRKPLNDRTLHVKGRYLQAVCQGECGLTDEALEQLDTVTKLQPSFVDAHVSKGVILAGEGKLDAAREAWATGKKLGGETARLLACEGFALMHSGQAKEAVFLLTKAARLDPKDTVVKFFLASALTKSGNDDAALRAYSDLLRNDPTNTQALYFRGRIHAKRRDYAACVKDMSSALMHDRQCLAAAVGRGAALTKQGQIDNAIRDFKLALAVIEADDEAEFVPLFTPDSEVADATANTVPVGDVTETVGSMLANLLLRKKDYAGAKEALDAVLSASPKHVSSLYYRSICSERLGNATQALKDINKALKLDNMNQQIVKRRRYLMHLLSTGRK